MSICTLTSFDKLNDTTLDEGVLLVLRAMQEKALPSIYSTLKEFFPNTIILEIFVPNLTESQIFTDNPILIFYKKSEGDCNILIKSFDSFNESAYDLGNHLADEILAHKSTHAFSFSCLTAYHTSLLLSALNDKKLDLPMMGGVLTEDISKESVNYLDGAPVINAFMMLLFNDEVDVFLYDFRQGFRAYGLTFNITQAKEDTIQKIENKDVRNFFHDLFFENSKSYAIQDPVCIEISNDNYSYCSPLDLTINSDYQVKGEVNSNDKLRFCKGNVFDILDDTIDQTQEIKEIFEDTNKMFLAFADFERLNTFNAASAAFENIITVYTYGQLRFDKDMEIYKLENNGLVIGATYKDA